MFSKKETSTLLIWVVPRYPQVRNIQYYDYQKVFALMTKRMLDEWRWKWDFYPRRKCFLCTPSTRKNTWKKLFNLQGLLQGCFNYMSDKSSGFELAQHANPKTADPGKRPVTIKQCVIVFLLKEPLFLPIHPQNVWLIVNEFVFSLFEVHLPSLMWNIKIDYSPECPHGTEKATKRGSTFCGSRFGNIYMATSAALELI